MPRDGTIMAEAYRQLQSDKAKRQARLELRTEEVYRRVPSEADIDRELQIGRASCKERVCQYV